MTLHQFSFPTQIYFGPGARNSVANYLKDHQVKRPLVVTDRDVFRLPFFEEFVSTLRKAQLESQVYSEVVGNPVKSQVTKGIDSYRAHKADGIVAIGGGAPLDVAKAIALMIHHPGDLFDYEDGRGRPMDQKIPLWIGLPTTSGTGSEVGRSTVISDDQSHVKKVIFSPKLLAQAVFADPELTLALPPKVTAATGMDALTHCVESYLAKDYHPMCDGIALEGLRIISKNLSKAVEDGKNLEARSAMMMAAIMGAVAFQKGLGLTHSCAHALSTVADLHHGLANGIMIDHALSFNVSACPERFVQMAVTIGLKQLSPELFLDWLTNLKKSIGIPQKLSQVGVQKSQIETLVDVAIHDGCHANNPRAVSRYDFLDIFTKAF